VDPSAPSVCYCPSTNTHYAAPLPSSNSSSSLCPAPLPLCQGSYLCHSSCLTCVGEGPSQCTACADGEKELVRIGQQVEGTCLPPCGPGQYRDGAGECQDPQCSAFNDCHQKGVCRFNGSHSVCVCDLNFSGPDCSVPRSCPALDECSGRGQCLLQPITGALFCRCPFPWGGPSCADLSLLSFSPSQGTEIGGEAIYVSSSLQFDQADLVNCTLGERMVPGEIVETSGVLVALCISPPHHDSLAQVPLFLSVNGGEPVLLGNYLYTYSGKLPRTSSELSSFRWETGVSYTRSYRFTGFHLLPEATFSLELLRWRWDPFSPAAGEPLLESRGILASGPNTGDLTFSFSEEDGFGWDRALSILSLRVGRHVYRQYGMVSPSQAGADDPLLCSAWGAASLPLTSLFRPCPSRFSLLEYIQCEQPIDFPAVMPSFLYQCFCHINDPLNCYYFGPDFELQVFFSMLPFPFHF